MTEKSEEFNPLTGLYDNFYAAQICYYSRLCKTLTINTMVIAFVRCLFESKVSKFMYLDIDTIHEL